MAEDQIVALFGSSTGCIAPPCWLGGRCCRAVRCLRRESPACQDREDWGRVRDAAPHEQRLRHVTEHPRIGEGAVGPAVGFLGGFSGCGPGPGGEDTQIPSEALELPTPEWLAEQRWSGSPGLTRWRTDGLGRSGELEPASATHEVVCIGSDVQHGHLLGG